MREGTTHTEEAREKIRRARTGRRHSEATKGKIAASHARRRLESALYRSGMRRAASRHGEGDLDFAE